MGNESGVKPNDWIDVGIMKYDGNGKHTYQYLQKNNYLQVAEKQLLLLLMKNHQRLALDPLHKTD